VRITINQEQSDLDLNVEQIESLVRAVVDFKSVETDEIVLYFVTKEAISEIHAHYFSDPTPTDCITFPIDPPNVQPEMGEATLGEVFVCPKVGMEYDKDSPWEEVSLYIIHGILHLIGYEDEEEEDRKKMRDAEAELLAVLKKKNLVLSNPSMAIQKV
jgi:probable rRNA maturation factor